MIVAVYTNGATLWQTVIPISPVGRVEKYSGQRRDSKPSPEERSAFATLLVSLERPHDDADANGFDARA